MLCCQCIYWMNILVTTIWKRLSHLHLARSRPCWTWTSPTTVLVLSREVLLEILSVSAASSWITTSWRRSRGPQYLSTICTCLTIKSSKNHCLYWIHIYKLLWTISTVISLYRNGLLPSKCILNTKEIAMNST